MRQHLRRMSGLLLAVACAAAAVAAGRTPEPSAAAAPVIGGSSGPAAAPSSSPSASSSPRAPSSTSRPNAAPFPKSGPGRSIPGSFVVASLDNMGAVLVWQRVLLPAPSTSVKVQVPDPRSLPGLRDVQPMMRDVQIQVGDQPVAPSEPLQIGRTVTVTLPEPTRSVALGYRLTGVAQRSSPAPVGRALIALAPAQVTGSGASGPTVIGITGTGVLGAQCPRQGGPGQFCAVGTTGSFLTRPLAAADAAVVIQATLAAPNGGSG